jgi:hypothetical protein
VGRSTGEKVDPVEYLGFVDAVFEEVVSLEVLVVVGIDDLVFKVDEVGRNDVVVYDLIGDLRQEEVEVNVVFPIEVLVDWLCLRIGTADGLPGRLHLLTI